MSQNIISCIRELHHFFAMHGITAPSIELKFENPMDASRFEMRLQKELQPLFRNVETEQANLADQKIEIVGLKVSWK